MQLQSSPSSIARSANPHTQPRRAAVVLRASNASDAAILTATGQSPHLDALAGPRPQKPQHQHRLMRLIPARPARRDPCLYRELARPYLAPGNRGAHSKQRSQRRLLMPGRALPLAVMVGWRTTATASQRPSVMSDTPFAGLSKRSPTQSVQPPDLGRIIAASALDVLLDRQAVVSSGGPWSSH